MEQLRQGTREPTANITEWPSAWWLAQRHMTWLLNTMLARVWYRQERMRLCPGDWLLHVILRRQLPVGGLHQYLLMDSLLGLRGNLLVAGLRRQPLAVGLCRRI